MIKTTITDRDPTTGRLVAIPPDLRDRVADAAKQLTVDLWDLGSRSASAPSGGTRPPPPVPSTCYSS